MFKTLFFVAIIAIVQCMDVKEKLKEDPVIKYQPPFAQQGQRLDGFRPRSDWSYFFPSWSHYFHDDDDVDEPASLLKRLTALEKEIKDLNDLLKKESTGEKRSGQLLRGEEFFLTNHGHDPGSETSTFAGNNESNKKTENPTTPSNKDEAASPCKDSAAKAPEDKMPEKTEKKIVKENKPAPSEEHTGTPKPITDSKEHMEKPEEPVKDSKTTPDKPPSKDGSLSEEKGAEAAP